jgi:hypothetical protein
MVIAVSNTNTSILKKFRGQFGGQLYPNGQKTNFARGQKTVWNWRLNSPSLQVPFLKAIIPYLFIKKRQAALALIYISTVVSPGKRVNREHWNIRLRVFRALRKLNRRGIEKPPRNSPPPEPSLAWNPSMRLQTITR